MIPDFFGGIVCRGSEVRSRSAPGRRRRAIDHGKFNDHAIAMSVLQTRAPRTHAHTHTLSPPFRLCTIKCDD